MGHSYVVFVRWSVSIIFHLRHFSKWFHAIEHPWVALDFRFFLLAFALSLYLSLHWQLVYYLYGQYINMKMSSCESYIPELHIKSIRLTSQRFISIQTIWYHANINGHIWNFNFLFVVYSIKICNREKRSKSKKRKKEKQN